MVVGPFVAFTIIFLYIGQYEYTLDDAIEHIGFGWFHVKLITIVGLSWVRYDIIYLV